MVTALASQFLSSLPNPKNPSVIFCCNAAVELSFSRSFWSCSDHCASLVHTIGDGLPSCMREPPARRGHSRSFFLFFRRIHSLQCPTNWISQGFLKGLPPIGQAVIDYSSPWRLVEDLQSVCTQQCKGRANGEISCVGLIESPKWPELPEFSEVWQTMWQQTSRQVQPWHLPTWQTNQQCNKNVFANTKAKLTCLWSRNQGSFYKNGYSSQITFSDPLAGTSLNVRSCGSLTTRDT